MSIPVVSARTFHRSFSHGRTAPSLIEAVDAQGCLHEVVLKIFSAGERGKEAATSELICSRLGTRLGLKAPQPFIVELPEGFFQVVQDTNARPRFEAATGQHFGSAYLAGAPTVAAGREIPAGKRSAAASVFAFDCLVQNPDRREEKPNLLEAGSGYWLIDHDMALAFLGEALIGGPIFPWHPRALGNPAFSYLRRHLLHRSLQGSADHVEEFEARLASVTRDELAAMVEEVPPGWWPDSTRAADMQGYLVSAIENGGKLCDFVRTFL
jgi:hypothetical protein